MQIVRDLSNSLHESGVNSFELRPSQRGVKLLFSKLAHVHVFSSILHEKVGDSHAQFKVLKLLKDAEIHLQEFNLLQRCESDSNVRELAVIPYHF